MKNLIVALLLLTATVTNAQKYFTKTGETDFKASVEAFEPVEAKSNSTTAILNTESGAVAALIFVKSFHFKVALMEEHFNENYMDSDEFPKAVFKGKLHDFDMKDLSEKDKQFKITGQLTIKGKTKSIDTVANMKLVDGKIMVNSEFDVTPQDFGIEIPSIVRKKIAESVKITYKYELVKKK